MNGPGPTWIDQHCHLPDDIEEAGAVRDEAVAAGVLGLVDVGTDVASSTRAADRAAVLDGVWATAGVHPHDATAGIEGLTTLLERPEVVAVGECGLDYHYMHSTVADQRRVFAAQIGLAIDRDLPLVIHTREAWDDTFDVLRGEGLPARVVFHCFTGGLEEARRCIEIGASLSFSGIVTFPSAGDVREAAAWCPAEHLLVETDSPYLAPVPHRGRPNRPAFVAVVGGAVAAVRGVEVGELAPVTVANTRRFYGLDEPDADGSNR